MGWDAVVVAIDTGDLELVAGRVLRLDERARREVAAALPHYLAVARKRAEARRQAREVRRQQVTEAAWREYVRAAARAGRTVSAHERWQRDTPWNPPWTPAADESWAAPMLVAGAAAIGGVAAVVAWLNRRDLQDRWDEYGGDATSAVLERVLSARPSAWQAEFAVRAALKLRPVSRRNVVTTSPVSGLVPAMLRRSGATPPEHDPLVVAWAAHPLSVASLRTDPLLDHLLPRLFEAEGVGAALRHDRGSGRAGDAGGGWLTALTALAREGRIDRDVLLDGCLRRFLRGGHAADLRFFIRLHDVLAPTRDEVRERHRDYLRLLPAAPGAVAETALKQVRRLGEADPAEVTEALRALLARGERKLLTAGLTWLDEFAAADPDADLDPLAPALGKAFGCESGDVQGRAVRVAVKHAKRFTGAGAQALRDAVAVLPQELGETLAELFGEEAGPDARDDGGFVPVPLPEPPPVPDLPPPVMSAADLNVRPVVSRWEVAEAWLAGVVRLHGQDRDGLAARLSEVPHAAGPPPGPWTEVAQWAEEIARAIVNGSAGAVPAGRPGDGPAGTGAGGSARGSGWERSRLPEIGEVAGPQLFLLRRLAEVYDGIVAGTLPPYLLAEPTEGTGHVDAGRLVDRVAGYERDGVEPMPADLAQALLRVPRSVAPDVLTRAGRLTSVAGQALALRLRGEQPEPRAEITWMRLLVEEPGSGAVVAYGDDRGVRPLVEEPGSGAVSANRDGQGKRPPAAEGAGSGVVVAYRDDREAVQVGVHGLVPRLHGVEPCGVAMVDELMTGAIVRGKRGAGGCMHWWPYVMPSHREVVAAHLVPYLLERWRPDRVEPRLARALASGGGAVGEAVALVQAYFMADRSWSGDPRERARAVVDMAARGDLDGEQVGRQLALLVRRAGLRPGPVFETLEGAAGLGAHREVWGITTGFLTAYLPGPGERPHTRHTQALTFALRAARWAGARGAVGCVAEIARRRASNTFVREARRLHTFLT
ncbi:DUF6493 family protein [Nonomuraea fuscirosea]|uniref:DUF6493 family protein n=1 Tax=Nonomuraea fuscirosea TaxID=1291556 RepID=UPI00343C123F